MCLFRGACGGVMCLFRGGVWEVLGGFEYRPWYSYALPVLPPGPLSKAELGAFSLINFCGAP